MLMNDSKPSISKKQAIDELWRRGHLSFMLDSSQKDLYKLFHESDHKVQTWLLSRRSGKTFSLCVLALEACIKKKNTIIKFVAPTKLQISTILRPLMKKILEECPQDIAPEFKAKDYIYYFPNGSEIQLAGSDGGHIEKLRGGDADICIIDEAGDVDDLKNAVQSVLLPTTLTTKGKVLISGTPPKAPDHEFIYFIEKGEMEGSLIKRTIENNPRVTQKDVDELIKELGGLTSSACRRELFCEIIKDENLSVIPEFTPALEKEIVKDWKKPVFYDTYVAMDLGIVDYTAVVFGYYDFRADKVIIEDEYAVRGTDLQLPSLVKKIKEIEAKHWTHGLTLEVRKPLLRVSDHNQIALNEMARISNNEVNFVPAKKDDKESALNNLRVLIANKKIIIHPRCVGLIRHLKNVKWASLTNKKTFARSPDDGHYDFVDAMIYFARHVDFRRNPYPRDYEMDLRREDVFINNPNFKPQATQSNQQRVDVFKKIFNIKR